MGIHPFTEAKILRTNDLNGKRVIKVRAYDSLSEEWHFEVFSADQMGDAIRWIDEKLSSLEMS